MAFVPNIVTVAEMQLMAGAGVGASDADANHTLLQDYAEAYLSMIINYDIATNWATLTAVEKIMISEWAARFAGMTMIAHDMHATYTSRVEAEDMINVHVFRMRQIEKVLQTVGARKILGGS